MSVWDDLANAKVEESTGFPDLPEKAWVFAKTCTAEHGGAAPGIKPIKKKDGTETHQFVLGLICQGGDAAIKKSHVGTYAFLQPWVKPDPTGTDAKLLLSGKLTGFLNAIFACGVGLELKEEERAPVRWRRTVAVLQEAVKARPEITPEAYGGDLALFIGACAVVALGEKSYPVLFKTRLEKYDTRDGEKRERMGVGAIEDAIPANFAARKIQVFGDEGTSGPASAPPAAAPAPTATF